MAAGQETEVGAGRNLGEWMIFVDRSVRVVVNELWKSVLGINWGVGVAFSGAGGTLKDEDCVQQPWQVSQLASIEIKSVKSVLLASFLTIWTYIVQLYCIKTLRGNNSKRSNPSLQNERAALVTCAIHRHDMPTIRYLHAMFRSTYIAIFGSEKRARVFRPVL